MKDIHSLPSSVMHLMQQAKGQLNNVERAEAAGNQPAANSYADAAIRTLGQAAVEIARHNPELAGLLLLSHMANKRSITVSEEFVSEQTTIDAKYLLGIRTGHSEHRTVNKSSRSRTIRID
jgi:hypothetical protein